MSNHFSYRPLLQRTHSAFAEYTHGDSCWEQTKLLLHSKRTSAQAKKSNSTFLETGRILLDIQFPNLVFSLKSQENETLAANISRFTEKALCPSGKCSLVNEHNVQSEHPWLAVEPSRMFLLLFSAVCRRIPGSGTSPNGWHCRLPWSFADNLWLMILTCRQISALILRQISSKQTTNIRLTTHKYWPTNICQSWTGPPALTKFPSLPQSQNGVLEFLVKTFQLQIYKWIYKAYQQLEFLLLPETAFPKQQDKTGVDCLWKSVLISNGK